VYNLRLGPITLRTDADATMSYSDNINLAKTGRLADVLITPSCGVTAQWKVSDLNTLSLNLEIGYQAYLFHSQYDSILLSPDSQAQFNFFLGDVAFNVHDAFSYQQDPLQIGQVSNMVQLARFQNDAGIQATWDLSSLILSLSYDHANLWVTHSVFDYLTNQSDTVSPKVTFKVDKTIDTGIETSFSDVRYDQNFQNDYTSVSAGAFVTAELTQNLSVNAHAGSYSAYYATGGLNGDTENVSSFYGSAGVNHRINAALSESLTAEREDIPGLTSNFTQRTYVNYTNAWKAAEYINVGSTLWWENLEDSDAVTHETSNRYGVGLNLDYMVTKQATLNIDYQYVLKNADPSSLDYYQNSVTTGLRYQF
jgi:hypothetical protein